MTTSGDYLETGLETIRLRPGGPYWLRLSLITVLVNSVLAINLVATSQESAESLDRRRRIAYYADESRMDELVLKLSTRYRAQDFVIRDVTLISVNEGRAIPGQAVVVDNGRITRIGNSKSIKTAAGVRVIDGRGLYLAPGLCDMHVHQFVSSSQHLLNLMDAVGQPLVINAEAVCGPTGTPGNDDKKKARNTNKNRTDTPADTAYVKVDRADLRDLPANHSEDLPGAPVAVEGSLVHKIKPEGAESPNCGLTDPDEVDWHIYLSDTAGVDDISKAAIVEQPLGPGQSTNV